MFDKNLDNVKGPFALPGLTFFWSMFDTKERNNIVLSVLALQKSREHAIWKSLKCLLFCGGKSLHFPAKKVTNHYFLL